MMTKFRNTSEKLRRTLAAFCAAAVLCTSAALISAPAASVSAENAIYAKTTAEISLRAGSGMNYGVIKTISKNSDVTVVDRSGNNWIKIKTADGQVGYCTAEYLDITTDAVCATYLNFRKGPGTNYASIKTLAPGERLDIIKFCGTSWLQVKLSDGTAGYVCNDYDYVNYLTETSTESKASTVPVQTVKNATANTDVKVTVSESSKTLSVGKTCTVSAKTTSGGTITWKSSDNSIAAVTTNGNVTAVREGKAILTATDSKSSKTATCTVTVTKAVLDSIYLASKTGTMVVGQEMTLTPKVTPSNGKVAFKSSSRATATVTDSGVITAKRAGSVNITAYDPAGGAAKATYKLTIVEKGTITISAKTASIDEGASCTLTASLTDGSAVQWTSSNTNIAAVRNGVVSGISPGTATITASDKDGLIKAACTVTVKDRSSYGVSLSRYSGNVTAGKTLYIQGYSSSNCWWGTSDSNIATVYEGFILAKNPGKAAITYTDASGHRAVCAVTVYESYPVKFTYSSPNSATKNSNVSLIAITDKKRTAVRFDVNVNGKSVIVNATKKVEDGDTYVWTGTYKATAAGTFNYSAYAKTGSQWLTCEDGKADIYVTSKTDKKTTACEKLRASDDIIKFIGEKEGFVSYVTYDELANNIPTLAHGYVIWEGETFYNGLTRNEGYALLVSAVNKEVYTNRVNEMLVANDVRFNQQQFDALVSFSYNLGTGWTYGSDLKDILLNSYGSVPASSSSGTVTAVVNADSGLYLRESYTTSSKAIVLLKPDEKVTLVSTQKYNSIWYKVKTSSGKVGYCSSTYLTLNTGTTKGRDLNYINKNAFINEMLAYHHAGGQCYYGLLYRRVDEVEMFLYGDYVSDGRSNKHNFPSPYCLSF